MEAETSRAQHRNVGNRSDLCRRLLATGDKYLVEAAARDRIWGIGYGMNQHPEEHVRYWGQNLLGKALMTVRER